MTKTSYIPVLVLRRDKAMMKKIILIFGILLFAVSAEMSAKQEYFEMTAERTGNTAVVKISSQQALKGFQFKIVCDAEGFETEAAEKGKIFDGAMVSKFEEKDGVVYALAAYANPCEAGEVCTVKFKIGDMPERAEIIMQDIKLATENETLNVPDIKAVIEGERREPEDSGTGGGSTGGGSSTKPGNKDTKPVSPTDKYTEGEPKEEPKNTVFTDIENHWGKADILFLNSKGIVKGISETLFSPNTFVTRAEFCALISRTLGLKETADNAYNDVESGEWYEKPILECTAAALVTGDGGLFRPNDIISRQETAVIISRVCEYLNMEKKTEDICGKYADGAQIEDWARSAVNNVVGYSVMQGYDESRFAPVESATRAQAAKVIRKIYDFRNAAEEK